MNPIPAHAIVPLIANQLSLILKQTQVTVLGLSDRSTVSQSSDSEAGRRECLAGKRIPHQLLFPRSREMSYEAVS